MQEKDKIEDGGQKILIILSIIKQTEKHLNINLIPHMNKVKI